MPEPDEHTLPVALTEPLALADADAEPPPSDAVYVALQKHAALSLAHS